MRGKSFPARFPEVTLIEFDLLANLGISLISGDRMVILAFASF